MCPQDHVTCGNAMPLPPHQAISRALHRVGPTLARLLIGATMAASLTLPSRAAPYQAGCSVTWIGGSGISWFEPNNWTDQQVPRAGDDVCVPAGTTPPHLFGSAQIQSLSLASGLQIQGGKLEITGPTESLVTGPGISIFDGKLSIGGKLVMSNTSIFAGPVGAVPLPENLRMVVNKGTLVTKGMVSITHRQVASSSGGPKIRRLQSCISLRLFDARDHFTRLNGKLSA